MKKKILIPGKKNFSKIGAPIKRITTVEKIPMGQIFGKADTLEFAIIHFTKEKY